MKKEKNRLDYEPSKFHITDVNLEFDLDPHHTRVKAVSQVVRDCSENVPLVLDGEQLELESVKVNGVSVEYSRDDVSLTIFSVPEKFELEIVNYIDPASNTEFEGLYMSDGAFCTQCEAEGFRRITYYLDRPDVSARFTTRVIADKALYPYLLSNGNRLEEGDLPNGKHYVVRQNPYSMPSYLFALVAGKFDVVEDSFTTCSGRNVELQLFVDVGNYSRGLYAMECIKKAMKWDEDRFGLEYDLDLFQVVAVDFFNMGAMENKGLNIFNSKYVLADKKTGTDGDFNNIESVIGHEYFHNWTGDRVTCRDWFQLSLKEGLTVFRDQEFSSDLGSRSVQRIKQVEVIRGPQFAEDLGPMAHPIRPDHVYEQNNFYTVTVYDKGAEIIRMIHTLIGEKNFQKGMKVYLSRFDGGCATCENFVRAMEDASGFDFKQFRHWYQYDGTPVVTPAEEYDEDTHSLSVTLEQRFENTPYRNRLDYPEMVITLKLELLTADGQQMVLNHPEVENGLYRFNSRTATLTFKNIPSRPTVTYLGDFSAPVKINKQYTGEELLTIARFSSNDFNRYDAFWGLYRNYFHLAVDGEDVTQALDFIYRAFTEALGNTSYERQYLSKLLTIPTELQVAEMFDVVQVDRIHDASVSLKNFLAGRCFDSWADIYAHSCVTGEYDLSQESIGKRSLRALAMSYIAAAPAEVFGTAAHVLGVNSASDLVRNHYFQSDNMTDTSSSLTVAVNSQLDCMAELLADFDSTWHDNGLVMDLWFRVQAGVARSTTIATVKKLMEHPAFSMSNPNRIRSLLGTFFMANPYGFFSAGAEAYDFITAVLEDLNTRNPQTASRIIEPLIKFSRYPEQVQEQMKNCLKKLSVIPKLSSDLYEKITKALEK